MSAIRVMLVDDHAVVRMGFKLLLQGADDIEVVAEAESGEDAIKPTRSKAAGQLRQAREEDIASLEPPV